MIFLQLLRNLLFNFILQSAACHHVSHMLGENGNELRNLRVRGDMFYGRILHDNALESQHTFTMARRTHELQRVHLSCLYNKLVRAYDIREHTVEGIYLPVQRIVALTVLHVLRLFIIFFTEKFKKVSHILLRDDVNLDLRGNLRMYLDDSLVFARSRNLLIKSDFAFLDIDVVVLLESLGNILARNGTEELAALTDTYLDCDLDLCKLSRHELCLVGSHSLLSCLRACLLLGEIQILCRSLHSRLAGKKEITAVALGYFYDISGLAEFFYVLLQDNLHINQSPYIQNFVTYSV